MYILFIIHLSELFSPYSRADEFEQQLRSGKDLASVAKEMAESITDPDIQATEVPKY